MRIMVAVFLLLGGVAASAATGIYDAHWDLLKNPTVLAENPQLPSTIRKALSAQYKCPRLVNLWTRGDGTPYGQKFEALCGPLLPKGDVFPAMHYAVYPEKGLIHVCKPFGSIGDCD